MKLDLRIFPAALAAVLLVACGGPAAPAAPSASPAASSAASKPATANASAATADSAKPGAGGMALNVAYSQATAGFGPLYIAKDAGIFQKNGLDVALKRITGTSQLPALVVHPPGVGPGC